MLSKIFQKHGANSSTAKLVYDSASRTIYMREAQVFRLDYVLSLHLEPRALIFAALTSTCVILQSSSGSYEDGFEGANAPASDVSARLRAFPRPAQSKADSKLQHDFQAKIKLDASKGWSSDSWKTYVPGKQSALFSTLSPYILNQIFFIFISGNSSMDRAADLFLAESSCMLLLAEAISLAR